MGGTSHHFLSCWRWHNFKLEGSGPPLQPSPSYCVTQWGRKIDCYNTYCKLSLQGFPFGDQTSPKWYANIPSIPHVPKTAVTPSSFLHTWVFWVILHIQPPHIHCLQVSADFIMASTLTRTGTASVRLMDIHFASPHCTWHPLSLSQKSLFYKILYHTLLSFLWPCLSLLGKPLFQSSSPSLLFGVSKMGLLTVLSPKPIPAPIFLILVNSLTRKWESSLMSPATLLFDTQMSEQLY